MIGSNCLGIVGVENAIINLYVCVSDREKERAVLSFFLPFFLLFWSTAVNQMTDQSM